MYVFVFRFLVDVGLSSLMLQMNDLTKLQELRVGTNIIQSMSLPPFMSTFKDFSLLDLHANNISIIKTDHTEAGLKALYGLNLSDADVLDGLRSIYFQEVYYYINERASEPISIFRCMINATNVLVKNGMIDEMEYVFFREIKELYLLYDHSGTLPGKQLSHLHTLEKRVIAHNIEPIRAGTFTDMPKLQYLDLSCNRMTLKRCCTTLLSGTPQIRYLNLSRNGEISLDVGGFDGLDSLEIRDFHHTRVVDMGYFSALSNLKYLRHLDVSYSTITFTNIYCFYGLRNLNVFKIAGNNFQGDVARYLFNNLTFLEHLNMSYCRVVELHPSSFRNLQRLRLLNLRGNNLMTIDFLAYPDLKQLTSLSQTSRSLICPLTPSIAPAPRQILFGGLSKIRTF
uniref:Toll-like receptor 4b, duplicate a n=1 Tax=Sinocyclocheilus anshuiensis TaxID=1608454 RepID=A0A671NKX8_9TELE